ncbi:type II toxin-antitoxin system RelE/ParE family toxin [Litoribrevibacter euphylliae]|uniref:Type II toxin-antitoxin system RelE/ParE family toxin n=1 Tax=Litoribrevibacter euphylliae TaxID=1834034 RepID=A0ABV7HEI2_9GAMM
MSYQLTVRKEAEQDIAEYFDYYEEIRAGLGHDFILCIEEALSKIERTPLNYRVIHNNVRRIAIRRFPHRVFYILRESNVVVIAVFHAQKDPSSWNKRL